MEKKNVQESIVFSDKTLTKRILFADDNVLAFMLNLKAGQTLPAHRHEHSTVVLHTLSGSADLRINDEVQPIGPGSVVQAKGEDDFEIPKVTEDISLYVTIGPNPANHLYSKEHG